MQAVQGDCSTRLVRVTHKPMTSIKSRPPEVARRPLAPKMRRHSDELRTALYPRLLRDAVARGLRDAEPASGARQVARSERPTAKQDGQS
jgi:hypothetical protein